MRSFLLLGHRGAPLQRSENTLPSFARAVELGADGVELDVQLSADGEVVIFHDEDLQRLTGRGARLSGLSWAELERVELSGGGRIPRLVDLLIEHPVDRWLDVELKAGGDPIVDATLRVLGGRPRTFLSSFDPRLLARARAGGWPHELALLLEARSPAFLHAEGGREFGAQGVILDAQIASARAVGRYLGLGYRVGVYGARDEAHEDALARLGLSWVITDRPRRPAPEKPRTAATV